MELGDHAASEFPNRNESENGTQFSAQNAAT